MYIAEIALKFPRFITFNEAVLFNEFKNPRNSQNHLPHYRLYRRNL